MIYFKTIRYKNFLSTGNAFTEIKLDKSPSTLIVGENGSGKSTMLDAITYALFNKPFRNVSKPQIINSINKKNCLTEIEFQIGSKNFKVRRGAQPSIFEIIQDDVILNQDANVRDYQNYLEENILKLNYKSFTQICVLGSASFTPFMQLHLGARREIIEDILDISIFTSMNKVLKTRYQQLDEQLRYLEGEIEVAKEKANIQKEYIEKLEKDKEQKADAIGIEIENIEKEIKEQQEAVGEMTTAKDNLGDVEGKRKKLEEFKANFNRQIKKHEDEIEFYHNNDDCPTCKQGIEHDFKEEMTEEKQSKLTELEKALQDLNGEYETVDKLYDEYLELNTQIMEANNKVISDQRIIQRLLLEQNQVRTAVEDIDDEKKKLKALAKDLTDKNNNRSVETENKHYLDVCKSLLQDSGIKTKIIKQYLPIINKLVNKYLAAMDFFVQFDLDETFKETIKSRHRDKFSYASFSEGEKQRIDLALVFTWRTIAKMKNSASTNLLLLDEVFDSSLDLNGTEYVMNLLNTIGEDTNVFVISHKGDQLFDKFRSVITFKKVQNYSVIQ